MANKKQLNDEQLEKVSGGISENVLTFVNQIIQTADQKVIAKYGIDILQDTNEYHQLLSVEIYTIYLTLSPQEKAMIDQYNREVEQLWADDGGVIYFAE